MYTKADVNIRCDSNYYKHMVFPISLVIAILFGVIIPVFLMIKLYIKFKDKKEISINFSRSLGILFLDHK